MCTLRYLSRCLLLWWLRSEFVCPSAERALPWPLVCIIIYLFQSIVLTETGSEGISGKISVFGKIEYYVKKKVRCFRWYRLTTSTLMRRQTGGGSGRTRNVRSLAICIYLLHSNMYLVNRPSVFKIRKIVKAHIRNSISTVYIQVYRFVCFIQLQPKSLLEEINLLDGLS